MASGELILEVRGVNKLPPIGPIGLALHGILGRRETLAADVGQLAKLLAKHIREGQLSQ